MSYPFRPAKNEPFTFDCLIGNMCSVFKDLVDIRTGSNTFHTMVDTALGGFSIFFTQSPSFLEFQRNMALAKGRSHAANLFQMTEIPSDNHLHHLLDPVPPEESFPLFTHILDGLYDRSCLEYYRSIDATLRVPIDGTQYFSSTKICCKPCTVTNPKKGQTHYSHTVVTPVIAAPGNSRSFRWRRNLSRPRVDTTSKTARTPQPSAGSPKLVPATGTGESRY
jgi:hypothetical protein